MGSGSDRNHLTLCLLTVAVVSFGAAAVGGTPASNGGVGTVVGHAVLAGETVPGVGPIARGSPAYGEETGPAERLTQYITGRQTATAESTSQGDIEYTQRFAQHEQQGLFRVTHEYRLPPHLRSLQVHLPSGATVISSRGFERDDGSYHWTGSSSTGRITYLVLANRTVDGDVASDPDDGLAYADAGEWALVGQPRVGHEWTYSGTEVVKLDRAVQVDGSGVAGGRMVYFGSYRESTRVAHGQRFRLVVPEQASLSADRSAILNSMAAASESLRVGERDPEVTVFAAPTSAVDWGLRGFQRGDADLWVQDVEPLDTPDNVWLHEYVHTRQSLRAEPSLEWVREGTAVYYAALLSHEQGRVSAEQFEARMAAGAEPEFDSTVLTQPDTWDPRAEYDLGGLVSGELDRRVRMATDGEHSLQTVFGRLNAHSGTASADTLHEMLATVGNGSVASMGDRYTRTTDRPDTVSGLQDGDAFGSVIVEAAAGTHRDTTVNSIGSQSGTEGGGELHSNGSRGDTVPATGELDSWLGTLIAILLILGVFLGAILAEVTIR